MLSEKVALGVLYSVLVCVLVIIICVQVSDEEDSHEVAKYAVSGGKAIRFHVLGDFGDVKKKLPYGPYPAEQVAEAMSDRTQEHPVDFVVTTGNNRYVGGVMDEFDQTVYKLMYHVFHKPGLEGKPWFLTLGSIDCTNDPFMEVDMTRLYSMWNMPALFYNFTLELENGQLALFVFLDSCTLACQEYDNITIPAYCEGYYNATTEDQVEYQYEWLKNLTTYYADYEDVLWRFVFLSIPPFSASSGDADNESLKRNLVKRLLADNFDIVFAGHETLMEYFYIDRLEPHNYVPLNHEESYECYNETYKPFGNVMHSDRGQALHQIVMGASGAPLESLCPNKTTSMASLVFGSVNHGFLEVSVSSEEVTANFLQVNDSQPVFNITILA